MTTMTRSGQCLCGAVAFEVELHAPQFSICHCGNCRRWSAGPYMAVHGKGPGRFTSTDALTWYRSSDWAERGFCSRCGTSLFYRLAADHDAFLIVAIDALDETDDLKLDEHIYADCAPDRYAFADDRPRVSEADFLKRMGLSPG